MIQEVISLSGLSSVRRICGSDMVVQYFFTDPAKAASKLKSYSLLPHMIILTIKQSGVRTLQNSNSLIPALNYIGSHYLSESHKCNSCMPATRLSEEKSL